MAAIVEVLSGGNQWKFSERNLDPAFVGVHPDSRIRQTLEPTGPLQQIVQEVQSRFIREDWQFTALLTDLRFAEADGMPSLAVIVTHPLRTVLVAGEKPMDLDFIRRGFAVGVEQLPPSDPINQILGGTWIVSETHAAYNSILINERRFKQTGVGIFAINLELLEQRISGLDERTKRLSEKLSLLQKDRAAFLALQSSNPVQLFPPD